jgi:uncharacterized glyoxalase superfamily protein PhnB/ketosteroid isomerase-like protein
MTHSQSSADTEAVARRVRAAFESRDLAAYGALLDDNVRWGGETDTPETCHTRAEVLERLASQRAAGVDTQLLEAVAAPDAVIVGFNVTRPVRGGYARGRTVYQVLKVRNQQVTDIRGFASRAEAETQAGIGGSRERAMEAQGLIPILNVSNLADSFDWFARIGWTKRWDWSEAGDPPGFGAVGSGDFEIFLSLDAQGARARGGSSRDEGVWLSIWVDDVDRLQAICEREGIEVVKPAADEPWGEREMHVRHPDGHVFRMTRRAHRH